jgi:poly-gamma-glutamate synthesis protein (capsule biosynthesis protein)
MSEYLSLFGDWAVNDNKTKINFDLSYSLINLEGPLFFRKIIKSNKAGPHLYNNYLPDLKNCILNLSNNHFMDYGYKAAKNTSRVIESEGNYHIGFGKNLTDSRKEIIIKINNKKIAFIGCSEPQFGMSSFLRGGIAETGSWLIKKIITLKKKVDYIVISSHGGSETSPWPIPSIRDLYRSWVDAGASIIHGHHSHMPQCYEIYKGNYIFYGMGNFAVPYDKWENKKNALWSLRADIYFDKKIKVKFNTIKIERINYKEIIIRESSDTEKEQHIKYFTEINKIFKNEKLFYALWQEVAMTQYFFFGKRYMSWQNRSIKNSLKEIFNKITNNYFLSGDKKKINLLRFHMLSLESHRQMLKEATGIISEEVKDLRNNYTKYLVQKYIQF